MIISCPECAGPFEVTDDRIAALVQVACPHCAFRMILDFAAANDPGLVEQGMRMASGFRSASDYHASVGSGAQIAASPEPEVEPEVAARPVAAEPAAPLSVTPGAPPVRVRPEPERHAPQTPPPGPRRPVAPVRPAAAAPPEASEEARTEVHMLPLGAERLVPVDIQPVSRQPATRDDDDIAVHVPAPATERVRGVPAATTDELAIDVDVDEEDEVEPATQIDLPPVRRAPPTAEPQRTPRPVPVEPSASISASDRAAHPAFGDDEEDMPTMVVPPEAREAAKLEMLAARRGRSAPAAPEPEPELDQTPSGRERLPPHTPPGRAKVAARGDDEKTPPELERPKRPVDEQPFDDEEEVERMSTFGVVMVLLLLLVAGGLIGASIALNDGHSPDPRPLLEKAYRQYVKGQ